ncbi:DMT family transporter [Petropleomorpha daqingensis]|uniref:Drug/metabolite transporter (DMT)-like permease n=1 Tax=Petropleomorpha daqingensis TaxID=2026353 RepID=A0A853CH02_9ACTN|nr:drug/metabolite transporter (DMT)-like permease [Petropleomorpha daqingensis]
MVVLLSLLAATAFALGTVLQQKGTLLDDGGAADRAGVGGVGFVVGLLRRPVWLLGGAVTAVGGVLQAIALHRGSLVVVQALATTSLVIALPFGAWLTDQQITPPVVLGACAMVLGIVLFVAVGNPEGGTGNPTAASWWLAGLGSLCLVGVLVWAGRSRTGSRQALLFGAAAGLGFGMASALTKAVTDVVGQGAAAVLGSWELYALLAAGLVGLVLGQSSLRTGALAPAMASTNSVMLLSSVWLGISVFGERFQRGGGHLAVAAAGLVAILAGVALLSRAPVPAPDGSLSGTPS